MGRFQDRYLAMLCLLLGGYALMGKGLASVGVAPLFVGEIVLCVGLCVVFASPNWVSLLATGPSVLLAALFFWTAFRAAPGVVDYGFDALRDAVIVGYGLFALIVITLMVERPERLAWVVSAYGRFAGLFGVVIAVLVYLLSQFGGSRPTVTAVLSYISIRPGEVAVHLAGIIIFTMAGLRRTSVFWNVMVLLGVGAISPSRGAMLACVLPVMAATVLLGKIGRFAPMILAAAFAFGLAYVVDLDIPLEGGRSMGPRQMVDNLGSLVGNSKRANLDNTKAWRLGWWQAIEGYTLHGDYFWTGKGFGQSLAVSDGFVVGEENGGPVLRSPHNAHMTILARMGVPGLVLWAGTCGAWFAMLLRDMLRASRRGDTAWHGLFVWIACYLMAILIDASFDVALEGPMMGVWFWSLFGLGISASMVYGAYVGACDRFRLRQRSASVGVMPGLAVAGRP